MDSSPNLSLVNDTPIPRRDLLLGALWSLCGIGIATPLARYFAAPLTMQLADPRVPVATIPLKLADNTGWQEVVLEFAVQEGWAKGRSESHHAFVRRQGDAVEVLSAICTHLGCQVMWIEKENVFHCPCHQGRFDVSGARISGPPQKPLMTLPCEIDGDTIRVSQAPRDEAAA